MRVFCAALLIAAVGLYVAFGGNRKDAATAATDDQGDQLTKVKKKFGEDFNDLADRFKSAKTAAEKKGVQTEAKELAVITAGKILKVAEADPKSDTALDAAAFALNRLVPIG